MLLFLIVALAQSVALALLAMRAGSASLYLPFKMMYLVVFPGAILGALALIVARRRRRGSLPAGRPVATVAPPSSPCSVPPAAFRTREPRSPINEPSYAVSAFGPVTTSRPHASTTFRRTG